jgi:predicted nucleic acid-binding Zn ribbon protein
LCSFVSSAFSGAFCQRIIDLGLKGKGTVGVPLPSSSSGFFLHSARKSFLPPVWFCYTLKEYETEVAAGRAGVNSYIAFHMHRCLTGLEFYPCPQGSSACPGGVSTTGSAQCNDGYTGILCGSCIDKWFQNSAGVCEECLKSDDPRVTRAFYIVRGVVFVVVVVIVVLAYTNPLRKTVLLIILDICLLFTDAVLFPIVSGQSDKKQHKVIEIVKWIMEEKLVRPEKFKLAISYGVSILSLLTVPLLFYFG